MVDRNLYTGLIRLHILHHAAEGPIFGQAMIDELGRHGYRLSAGTLYPILHGMERQGYLRSQPTLNAGASGACIARRPPAARRSSRRDSACRSSSVKCLKMTERRG